jgi:DNA-binding transcriptional LysR family regulator
MRGMLDWDDVRFFLALQRARTLGTAARQLGVNASTVARRLAALEAQLETRVLERSEGGYVLTEGGEALLARAEAMEDAALGAEREVAGREARLSGTLRLTAPEALGGFFLPPLLARFQQRYPDIDLELVADNRPLSISRREADLALRLVRPTQPSLVVRRVAEVGTALFASRAYLDSHPPVRPPDLEGHALIGYDEPFVPELEQRWLQQQARGARVRLRTARVQAQLEAAHAGLGLALLPCYLARARGGLVQVLPPSRVVRRSLWLVVHEDLRHLARVRALSDFLVRQLAAAKAALAGR